MRRELLRNALFTPSGLRAISPKGATGESLSENARKNETMQKANTHAGKAESYDLGRPAYPKAFYDYLYGAFGLTPDAVIADIGAGTGKITQGFAQRGNRVYAVEPDDDMRHIAQERLSRFESCTVLGNYAEDTGIPTGAADMIFCGNSYHWFDRARVIPEFKRILKSSEGANVILAWLRGAPRKIDELHESLKPYVKLMDGRHSELPPFKEGTFEAKAFEFTLYQDWNMLLNGLLSFSGSPNPGDDCCEAYCQTIRRHFDRHGKDGKLETKFKLTCMTGNVKGLADG